MKLRCVDKDDELIIQMKGRVRVGAFNSRSALSRDMRGGAKRVPSHAKGMTPRWRKGASPP
jgi:hypothetical protein